MYDPLPRFTNRPSKMVPPSLYHTYRGNPPSHGAPIAPRRIAVRSHPLTSFRSADRSTRVPVCVVYRTRTDIGMRLGALGARGALLEADENGGIDLALEADAFLVQMDWEKVSSEKDTQADASRLRMVLEGSRAFALGEGSTLTPGLELGLRHDGGDAAGLASGGEFEAERRLEAQLGYGFGAFGERGLVTPYAGLGLAEAGERPGERRCPRARGAVPADPALVGDAGSVRGWRLLRRHPEDAAERERRADRDATPGTPQALSAEAGAERTVQPRAGLSRRFSGGRDDRGGRSRRQTVLGGRVPRTAALRAETTRRRAALARPTVPDRSDNY